MCCCNCSGFEPKDLYRVWRTGALIEDFENLDSFDPTVDADGLPTTTTATTAAAAGGVPKAKALVDVVVPTALAQSAAKQNAARGMLSQKLAQERNHRMQVPGGRGASGAIAGAAARFQGVYQRPVAHTAALPALGSSSGGVGASGSAAAGAASANNNRELDHILGSSAPTARNPATAAGAGASANTTDSGEPAVQCHLQVSKIIRDPFQLSGAAVPHVQAKRNKKNLTFSLVSNHSLFFF